MSPHPGCMKVTEKQALAQLYRSRKRYGLSYEDIGTIYDAQEGECAICHDKTLLVIDHDHDTGHVRGFLCTNCNTMLGKAYESVIVLERAIEYLKNPIW